MQASSFEIITCLLEGWGGLRRDAKNIIIQGKAVEKLFRSYFNMLNKQLLKQSYVALYTYHYRVFSRYRSLSIFTVVVIMC